MGIYYDDPYNLQNPNDFRACIGFLLPQTIPKDVRETVVKHFAKTHQIAEVPKVPTVFGEHPMRIRMLSYPLGAIKYYPASLQYMG